MAMRAIKWILTAVPLSLLVSCTKQDDGETPLPLDTTTEVVPGQELTVQVLDLARDLLERTGIPDSWMPFSLKCVGVALILLVALIADLIARRGLVAGARRLVTRTQTAWDDMIVRHKVLTKLARIAPALVIYITVPVIFADMLGVAAFVQGAVLLYMLVVVILVVFAILDAAVDIYRTYEVSRRMPIKGILQVVKIVLFFIAAIIGLSIVTDESSG